MGAGRLRDFAMPETEKRESTPFWPTYILLGFLALCIFGIMNLNNITGFFRQFT